MDGDPYLLILGIAQDAGYPHAGCGRDCCARAWVDPSLRRGAACAAIVDPGSGERWLLDCTPDFREQLHALNEVAPSTKRPCLDGILLTHAHIGHYAGLVNLGREAMDSREVPVHAMTRMRSFLEDNAPWSQLVEARNIVIGDLEGGMALSLNARLAVTPLAVPHRDEFSETVGFRIEGPRQSILYLPDIDKWERWECAIEEELARVDVAYVDGTFFADGELPGCDMSRIPHPFIMESIDRFAPLPGSERDKLRFFHLNHTNPALDRASEAVRVIQSAGHRVAEQGERVVL